MSVEIKGIIAALQTPMFEDGSINEAEMRNQINREINAGVDAVFCLGTNGEFYILSMEEKIRVMEIYVDEVKGRVPVYAGTGCVSTADTIYLSQKAKEIGVDVLSIITPYFAAINQEELYYHYSTIAAAVDMPIVIYNIPMRTGVTVEPETIARLADIPNIVGVKDSSGRFELIQGYLAATKDKEFSVLSGNDALILDTLKSGGAGGITAISNILPEIMVSIYQKFIAGDEEGAREAQNSIAPIRACFKFGNPNSIVKVATNLMGHPVGPCRKPFGMVSEEAVAAISECINTNYAQYKKN